MVLPCVHAWAAASGELTMATSATSSRVHMIRRTSGATPVCDAIAVLHDDDDFEYLRKTILWGQNVNDAEVNLNSWREACFINPIISLNYKETLSRFETLWEDCISIRAASPTEPASYLKTWQSILADLIQENDYYLSDHELLYCGDVFDVNVVIVSDVGKNEVGIIGSNQLISAVPENTAIVYLHKPVNGFECYFGV